MAELKCSISKGKYPTEQLKTSLSTKKVKVKIGGEGTMIVTDHSKLTNLDYGHSGHTGFAGIEFGTTAEWNARSDYRPALGVIIVYTDYAQETDPETGEVYDVPGIKIGDGNAYLIDKPFVGEDTRDMLIEHINNEVIHITAEERQTWNDKLNYVEPDSDLLEFTRD